MAAHAGGRMQTILEYAGYNSPKDGEYGTVNVYMKYDYQDLATVPSNDTLSGFTYEQKTFTRLVIFT
ncbi:MAG: hypothetical protein RSJ41_11735, partial [Clostridia bacterium]